MKNNKIYRTIKNLTIFILLTVLFVSGCQPANLKNKDTSKFTVTVSILPQAYFVERIGADAISVNVMVGPGEEPHTYEPKPEQMRGLSSSQLFFTIGTEYEGAWLPRFKDVNPDIVFVDSAAGIKKIPLLTSHHHDDEAEIGDAHTDEDLFDPHVWLSTENGKIIAKNILEALVKYAPENEAEFQSNYKSLIDEIDALDKRIQITLKDLEQRTFMVFHPAWGYFAEQYQLEQVAVEVGGQEPSPTDMINLVKIAVDKQIHVIFIQPTFSKANATAIAKEINAEVAVVDPLAKDWLKNLEIVADAFASAVNH